jgi:hypothetical protein
MPMLRPRSHSGISGYFAAKQQHAYSPILKNSHAHTRVDWGRIFIVGLILVFAITANVVINLRFNHLADAFPFIGVAVWLAILLTAKLRRHDWELMPDTFKGTVFLLSLVSLRLDDAGGDPAGTVRADRALGSASSPPSSTIFR